MSLKASGCGLTSTLPKMLMENVWVDGTFWVVWPDPPLGNSLQALDASWNHIEHVDGLPAKAQTVNLAGNPLLSFRSGVLKDAVISDSFMDLQDVELRDTSEAEELLMKGLLTRSTALVSQQEVGYACHAITNRRLLTTPSKILPNKLCACKPGWFGKGANCQPRAQDTYTDQHDERVCRHCPEGSAAAVGSASVHACACSASGQVPRL